MPVTDLDGSHSLGPEESFPAPSSGLPSRMSSTDVR
jgi:hypothetical protein